MNRATLITADKTGGYDSGPFQPSSLTPSTANAHTIALSYSLRVIRCFNNAMQNSKHARWPLDNLVGGMMLLGPGPGRSSPSIS